ncbi:conserved exported protein of unknown function [Nitrospira japonica]|uniref:DUF5666 domain-containing protein n=1 Tax=Nitrospira japonica TaxID=1325564 RepID=A0A1W1I7U6_9BACT|nr:hypothetical protein [Nitrospira japonica]SLM48929.1 conserved exported protein of unknown function [Nitrospira japonica]
MPIVYAFLLLLAAVTTVQAQPVSQTTINDVVKGDVLYWEGEELVVREISGHEVRMRVTADTKIEGAAARLKTGDKIAAQLAADGHATTITLQIPDGDASTAPRAR